MCPFAIDDGTPHPQGGAPALPFDKFDGGIPAEESYLSGTTGVAKQLGIVRKTNVVATFARAWVCGSRQGVQENAAIPHLLASVAAELR